MWTIDGCVLVQIIESLHNFDDDKAYVHVPAGSCKISGENFGNLTLKRVSENLDWNV